MKSNMNTVVKGPQQEVCLSVFALKVIEHISLRYSILIFWEKCVKLKYNMKLISNKAPAWIRFKNGWFILFGHWNSFQCFSNERKVFQCFVKLCERRSIWALEKRISCSLASSLPGKTSVWFAITAVIQLTLNHLLQNVAIEFVL